MTVGNYSTAFPVTPEALPEDMGSLTTNAHDNLVHAINEVLNDAQATEAGAFKWVRASIGASGVVALPALPAGAHVTGLQVHVSTAYSVGATLNVGDHSGAGGSLAAASISAGAGITLTTAGDYEGIVYVAPVGALQLSIAGAGAAGAAVVIVEYMDS